MPADISHTPSDNEEKLRIFVVGSTGTIGRAALGALRDRGYHVTAFIRHPKTDKDRQKLLALQGSLPEIEFRFGDVTSQTSLIQNGLMGDRFDAVLSCLGSRTGHRSDVWAIDYQANLHVLTAAQKQGIRHFVYLSALCVQKPRVTFQFAKRAFEDVLIASGIAYSIVRPTAFFKSLSGQVERIRAGRSFLVFGDGRLTACKPISDRDLGVYLADCFSNPTKRNKILPIGGPGNAITPLDQAHFLFGALKRKPLIRHVPLAMMRVIIGGLTLAGYVSRRAADHAEFARIGYYYATESMLLWNDALKTYDAAATPSTGQDTLFDHYLALISGQSIHERSDHSVF